MPIRFVGHEPVGASGRSDRRTQHTPDCPGGNGCVAGAKVFPHQRSSLGVVPAFDNSSSSVPFWRTFRMSPWCGKAGSKKVDDSTVNVGGALVAGVIRTSAESS